MKNQDFRKTMKQIQSLIEDNRWQDAYQALCLADAQNPNTPAILTAMGDCQIHMEKPAAAIPHFLKVTELEPSSVEAFNNLGVAYMFNRDFTRAESAYLEALQFVPDHLQTLKNLAFLYYQQEDRLRDAVTLLAGVIRSNPSDFESLFLMGQCYEMGNDVQSARLCYERVLVHQPDYALAVDALNLLKSRK
jgi:tetratricopeptide (TPR) repeat protein